ncbi:DUF1295 domain-containing protein [Myxococcota bacterium]|nr:DUF1295 domain-containing protein [Myxococcota bacterium]
MVPIFSAIFAVVAVMTALWGVSLVRRDASVVDLFWGPGFAIIAWTLLTSRPTALGDAPARALVLAALVTLWAARLAIYLAWRNAGKPEDWRYRKMREEHGARWWWQSFFIVFGLQGVLMLVVALPLFGALVEPATTELGVLDLFGVALFATGLSFETVGDLQLARFKADPANAGQVMDRGLWRYTRHPNYFGDFCVWWGLYAIALAGGAPLWTVAGPILMSVLLLRVSGVALLEAGLSKRKPGYADYVARTSAFFPWPPRRTLP